MSGLCGWLGSQPIQAEQHHWLEAMAAPLTRCTGKHIHSRGGRHGALAATSSDDSADIYQNGDLLAVVAGTPYWSDQEWERLARQHGQAKTLADGFERKGVDVLKFLRGSYAIAVLRENQNEVLLAVDRMGTHPMSYAVTAGLLAFGSSTDCVRAHPAVGSTLDPQAIFDYIYYNMVPSPRTIYAEQKKLEPAQFLHFKRGQVTTGYHWLPTFQETTAASFHELSDVLGKTLKNAVTRSAPDCHAGAFLSGGIDSTTVSGVFSGICQSPVNTYTIGFDVKGYDEMEYARIAARHFGLNAHEYYVTPQDVEDAIPLIAQAYDEPFGNSSALPVYYCALAAKRDGIDTMLAGDGGDELFGGNERYVKQQIFEHYSQVPKALRKYILDLLAFSFPGGQSIPPLRKLGSYIKQARVPLPERLETYNMLHMVPLTDIFERDFLKSIDAEQPVAMMRDAYSRAGACSSLNSMLYLDWKFTLADNDLRKVNRMCALAGIEVRYPMLDDELIDFSTQVPSHLKIKRYQLRYFFKRALKNFLPASIIAKSKHGFGLPFGEWLRNSPRLQELVYDNLRQHAARGYFRPDYIDQLIKSHQTDHAGFYGSMIWTILLLELWLQEHAPVSLPR
ncbi:MAG: asparagine synthase-related protein [Sulfuricaulis sp.]|nr:asparagine synthase-related protein [Sulfuricaulis sp.]